MSRNRSKRAFTLVEMLLVVAIISILAAMAISNFSNASQDTRDIVARQQLAVVQEALHHWVNKEVGKVTTANTAPKTISQVQTAYNGAAGAARYDLFKSYLDESMTDPQKGSLSYDTGTGRLTTQAMRDTGRYLTLPDWGAGNFPKVQFN